MSLSVIRLHTIREAPLSERKREAEKLSLACRKHACFLLEVEGGAALREEAFGQAEVFFGLPVAEKQKISIANSPAHRGWFDIGEENLDPLAQKKGDRKEGIKIGQHLEASHPKCVARLALHGQNQYPKLPDFQRVMLEYYADQLAIGRVLLRGFALALGIAEDWFEGYIREPMATLGPLYYPPASVGNPSGAGAHTDFGCLTLLTQKGGDGLEVKGEGGVWQKIHIPEGHLLVTIGDMMGCWSGGRFAASLHRVVYLGDKPRYSLPFFFDPDPDTPIYPLASPAPEKPKTALQYLLEKINASFSYRHY